MRRSTRFLLYVCLQLVFVVLVFAHASFRKKSDLSRLREAGRMVENLGLTDLCLFTEASYTRRPSLADLHTAFQDSPMALEHFPSGSLVIPPQFKKGTDENVD